MDKLLAAMSLDEVKKILGDGSKATKEDMAAAFGSADRPLPGQASAAETWMTNGRNAGVSTWYQWRNGDDSIFVGFGIGKKTGKERALVSFWVSKIPGGFKSEPGLLVINPGGDPDRFALEREERAKLIDDPKWKSGNPKVLIVGTWRDNPKGNNQGYDFKADGSVIVFDIQTFNATYRFADDANIEIMIPANSGFPPSPEPRTKRYQVLVNQDELVLLTDEKFSRTLKYRRTQDVAQGPGDTKKPFDPKKKPGDPKKPFDPKQSGGDFASKLNKIRPGFTVEETEAILGKGNAANLPDIDTAFGFPGTQASQTWGPILQQPGPYSLYQWRAGDETVFVAFYKGKKTGKDRALISMLVRKGNMKPTTGIKAGGGKEDPDSFAENRELAAMLASDPKLQGDPKKLIVGRWATGQKLTDGFDFNPDGSVIAYGNATLLFGTGPIGVTYSFNTANQLEISRPGKSTLPKQKDPLVRRYLVFMNQADMILMDVLPNGDYGNPVLYKRVK
ncbi:MAG TPA: hypothetical protein VE988_29260 [Gemmataceae bacterium]|nr:hypothetical protein [Gemmataceae bacterium]